MKKVLITGANSYIGTHVEAWLMKEPDKFQVDTLDMQDPHWKDYDFSSYDVVYHVAGIAHVSSKKKLAPLYFKVNRDLAIETAEKAKLEGVKQFIFMSSMIIYGKDKKIGDFTPVNKEEYAPINAYGQSKLEADLYIQNLNDKNFKTCVIRTPMVYGEGSKGNYPRLKKLALTLPIFPKIDNKRSIISIENLMKYIKCLVEEAKQGVLYPQDDEYFNTREFVKKIRESHGKKYRETRLFNLLVKFGSFFIKSINKIFGNKYFVN